MDYYIDLAECMASSISHKIFRREEIIRSEIQMDSLDFGAVEHNADNRTLHDFT